MAFLGTDFDHAQLSRQLASLVCDAGNMAAQLRRFGGHTSHDLQHFARDLGGQALHQGAEAAQLIGMRALRSGKAVGRDPVPAIVAVAGLACLINLVLASGRARQRR